MKIEKVFLLPGMILFLTIASWISSCTHKADIGEIDEICFERDVLPVFQNSCAKTGCHNGSGESDLILTSYVPISHAVEPGNPSASRIYKAITATWGENQMPPDQPLTRDNRTIIRLWIEQGARLTTCTVATGTDAEKMPQAGSFTACQTSQSGLRIKNGYLYNQR